MLVTIITDVIGGVLMFVFGAVIGANNTPTVSRAITAIKAAELSAQDTLAKITAHKAD